MKIRTLRIAALLVVGVFAERVIADALDIKNEMTRKLLSFVKDGKLPD
jgi:hypothetical protein